MESEINSWNHALSAARKWGGIPEDTIAIQEFIDSSKKVIGDIRHRSVFHHTLGIWVCQEVFGRVIRLGKSDVPVRLVAERHILEDLGWLPSPADYIKAGMELAPWMSGSQRTHVPLSAILGEGNGITQDFVGAADSR